MPSQRKGTEMHKLINTVSIAAVLASQTVAYAQDKPTSITVAAYGGVWAESIKKNIIPCFEQKTGVKVQIATGESSDWLAKIRANPANPPISIVALSEADSFRAQADGLLDQLSVRRYRTWPRSRTRSTSPGITILLRCITAASACSTTRVK